VRLAHLGPRGTYTEAASVLFDPGAALIPTATVSAAIEEVTAGRADAAVCALENSIDGSISIETLDLLLNPEFPLRISGEVVVPVEHVLVGAPGVDIASAERVYSHPSALAQCRRRIAEIAPRAEPVAALSTTAAIEAALAEPGALAIGNERAAALYGAHVYARNLGDERGNATRFVVLSAEDAARTGDDKTSIAFTTQHDRPGSLVEVLHIFSTRGINMTRIESRPTRRQLGTYVFLVDVQGHRTDATVAEALEQVAAVTHWLKVLGSYPRWQSAPAA
jgi:prephenate dehydratase